MLFSMPFSTTRGVTSINPIYPYIVQPLRSPYLVSRFITPITHIITVLIPIITLLT